MDRPAIAIAHQTVWMGDAIGNDILGTARLLQRCGYRVEVACENAHPSLRESGCVRLLDDAALAADLLIYHHSNHWPRGEELLARFEGPAVVKYHNVTPSAFFAPYSARYREMCDAARAQTARMAAQGHVVRWQADSAFNSEELAAHGVPAERRGVVPPFNRLAGAMRAVPRQRYEHGPYFALFVGRRAPNKGHLHLLRTIAAWQELFPESELRCRIIGATDPELNGYYAELDALESALGVRGAVEWLGHVTDEQVADLFRSSHFYLNLSEHEGFCVPVVEAQAAGLPVVTTDVSALADTVGPGQITVPVPVDGHDYDFVAGLAHAVCQRATLRESVVSKGFANAWKRFSSPAIEDRFLEDIEPVLQGLEA
jgi:glycosyltransferase involved in cell wall biosynthesis